LAAYLLQAWILLALVVLTALVWIIHMSRLSSPAPSLG
jgi:hypothetical protein